jgi:hypothetical protein
LQRGEGGKGREPLEGPENHIKLITYSTEYRIQNTEYTCSKLVYIKLPMYLFFYVSLGLNDFDGGNYSAIGRGGP